MADRLISLLVPRTVLIASGKSIGTGCFIAPGYILTCAHVVREPLPAGEFINVYYAKGETQKNDPLLSAKVKEVFLSDLTEGKEYPDVAILKIEEQTHPLLQLSKEGTNIKPDPDQEYVAVGFQKKEMETGRNIAQTVSLNYEGEEGAGYMKKLTFENGLVRPGMSGAPLVERQSGLIVGIVHMTRDANSNLGAIVIPAEKIWEVIREKTPSVYQWLASKKGMSAVRNEYRKSYPLFPMIREYKERLFVLPIILFFLFFWIFRNVGQIQQAEYVAALLVVIGFSGKLLSDWMGSDVAVETGNAKSKAGNVLFRWPVISFLGFVTLALWLCVTSVWIINHDGKSRVPITLLKDLDSESSRTKEFDRDGTMRFLIPMIPFEDSIFLKAEGREPIRVMMHSTQKVILHYPDSFILEPVVLVLFDPNSISYDSFSNYEVHIKLDPTINEIINTPTGNAGSLMIGKRKMEITEELEKQWKENLQPIGDPGIINSIINKWKISVRVAEADLSMGTQIELKLVRKSDQQENKKNISIDHEGSVEIFNF